MPRQSKLAKSLNEEIKSQPRRPRKKREPIVIPLGFKVGQLVKVTAPREMKGVKLGIVFGACKYDEGIVVRLSDDGSIAKYICVRPELGDIIERLNNSDNGESKKPNT